MKRFLFVILCLLPLQSLLAYSTPNVPVDDPVYRDIDKLIAAGLVKDVIYGQRPWSRREIARVLSVAQENRKRIPPEKEGDPLWTYVDPILSHRLEEYPQEQPPSFHPLEKVQFDSTLLDSPPRPIPQNNGLGSVDAQINPLVNYQEGRHYVDGSNLGLETTHSAQLSRYLSLYARPRLEFLLPNTGNSEVKPLAQQLYGKFAFRNFELEAGRDSFVWGQGENGGLMFSNHARPVDMIKLTTSGPFYHPWIFKYLGPSKYTFFVANLGPEREFPYATLYGIKGSIKPFSIFEFSLHHTILLGGDGSPSGNWHQPIEEFFFFRNGGLTGRGGQNTSDHRFGGDLRLRIPPLRNLEWYFEATWDDVGRQTVLANITEQMALVTGVVLPWLSSGGRSDARIEYIRVPPVFYRHATWTSGYALNRNILGMANGPDTDEIHLVYQTEFNPTWQLRSEASYLNSDSNIYTQTSSTKGGPDQVIIASDQPTEHRFRLQWSLTQKSLVLFETKYRLGFEHVENFNFMPDARSENLLFGVEFTATPSFL